MSEPLAATDPRGRQNLLAFRLNRQTYALPADSIVQIIPMVTITPLPHVSDMVEGVINVRGEVVPVVDLRRHLSLPQIAPTLHTPILLIRMSEWTVGLIVDEVVDVLVLSSSQVIPPIDVFPERLGRASILQGLVYTSGGMGLLLNPAHLFLPDQMEALVQATSQLPEWESQVSPDQEDCP